MHSPFSSTGHQSPKERKYSPPRHFRSLITRLAGSSRSHLQEVVIPPKIYATLITDYFTECSSFVNAHHWSTSETRGCLKSLTVQKVLENSQKIKIIQNHAREPNRGKFSHQLKCDADLEGLFILFEQSAPECQRGVRSSRGDDGRPQYASRDFTY